jgi:NADPH2 dehydrogenase
MGMADPVPTFSHVISEIKRLYSNFAYLHIIEPRISGDITLEMSAKNASQSNDFIREIWGDRPLISAGGYTRDTAIQLAERTNALVSFGRHFLANVGPRSFFMQLVYTISDSPIFPCAWRRMFP